MVLENIKIVSVGAERTGTSSTTGKQWKQRDILLGFEDETGESYISAQVDGDLWTRLGHWQGQVVTLNVRFRTKRFTSGWVANDIRIVEPKQA